MDIKSLMIGDWVYDTHNRQNGRVQEIGSGMVMLNCNDLYEFDEIEPIPLTKEILEKNGFSHNEIWHNSYVDIENYHIDVQFGYGGKVDNIRIRENGKDSVIPSEKTNLYLSHIEYLHELQHAMKLCGIEKEIEL